MRYLNNYSFNIWLLRRIMHVHTENLLMNSGDPIALCMKFSISVSKTGPGLALVG